MRSVWSVRLLRALALAAAVAAGTGVLLSVPPLSFFIYPVYPYVYIIHRIFTLAVAVPFVVGLLAHGVGAARARGFSGLTRSGLLLTATFLAALASAVYSMLSDDTVPGLLLVHMGAGIVALVTVFVHAPRFWQLAKPRRRADEKKRISGE